MYNIARIAETGMPVAVLFINSNKSEKNIRRKIAETRKRCFPYGVILGHDVVVGKGPDRDIDRDAVNMLISLLATGRYNMVAVEMLADLTEDSSDLKEFMRDAASIGISFLELSTMKHYMYEEGKTATDNIISIWNGGGREDED
ncbi:MAG: hypothetical protein K2M78_15285 [Lachnospiraceae bacterium]|nr:hypothetical protein [Lachnospiraceae bacterium]